MQFFRHVSECRSSLSKISRLKRCIVNSMAHCAVKYLVVLDQSVLYRLSPLMWCMGFGNTTYRVYSMLNKSLNMLEFSLKFNALECPWILELSLKMLEKSLNLQGCSPWNEHLLITVALCILALCCISYVIFFWKLTFKKIYANIELCILKFRSHKHKVPYVLAYKSTIFGLILTFKLWGSAYTRVMPVCHTARVDSQHDGYLSVTLTVCVPHTAWTISKSLVLRGCVGESTSAGFWMTTHKLVLLHSQPLQLDTRCSLQ